jgi:hypothetical protein
MCGSKREAPAISTLSTRRTPIGRTASSLLTLNKETGAFQAETIYIHKGTAVCRGKEYVA